MANLIKSSYFFKLLLIACILNLIINLSYGQRQRQRENKRDTSCGKLNYLLDQETKRCYLVGSRGPCGELMTFYKHPRRRESSKYGFCDCDQGNIDPEMPCKDSPIRRRVYVHSDQRCYTVFSQGPCKQGEYLILNESGDVGECILNPCLQPSMKSRDTADQFWFYDPNKRQCYKSFSQGYCPKGMHLELVHDSQYPQCKIPTCSGSLAVGIRSFVSCQSGSRLSYFTRSCKVFYNNNFFGIIG